MSELYTKFAGLYHEMYQEIFDYHAEFKRYHNLLQRFKAASILELACGSGNMARYFLENHYKYVGLDLSAELIDIAKEENPEATFEVVDMRNMKFEQRFDAVIIPGRSFTHLLSNEDVLMTLNSIYNCLEPGGVLIFDNFNARRIIQLEEKEFKQVAQNEDRIITRISRKNPNFATGWTENWISRYVVREKGKTDVVFEDETIIRSFIPEEINLFLKLCNFVVTSIIHDGNTFMHIASID